MKPLFYSIILLLCFTGVRAETPVDSMPVDKETDLLCAPDKNEFWGRRKDHLYPLL